VLFGSSWSVSSGFRLPLSAVFRTNPPHKAQGNTKGTRADGVFNCRACRRCGDCDWRTRRRENREEDGYPHDSSAPRHRVTAPPRAISVLSPSRAGRLAPCRFDTPAQADATRFDWLVAVGREPSGTWLSQSHRRASEAGRSEAHHEEPKHTKQDDHRVTASFVLFGSSWSILRFPSSCEPIRHIWEPARMPFTQRAMGRGRQATISWIDKIDGIESSWCRILSIHVYPCSTALVRVTRAGRLCRVFVVPALAGMDVPLASRFRLGATNRGTGLVLCRDRGIRESADDAEERR